MKKVDLKTTIYVYESPEEFTKDEQHLINMSKEAVKTAYAPYSGFQVGAAVLLQNGEIITGANQENAAYPSGLCAERVAIFYANSMYPEIPVKAIAVSAFTKGKFIDKSISPCGSCRQVLIETEVRFKTPIKIYLISDKKVTVIDNAKSLLPLNFEGHFLE